MPPSSIPPEKAVAQLCPHCALCCNGVLFKDVELQAYDNGTKLESFGVPVSEIKRRKAGGAKHKFPQPCAALDGCRCRVYADRPVRCQQFECALLQSVQAGKTGARVALGLIRNACDRADRVRTLLREVGDVDETLALSLRFKRTKKRLEASPPNDARAETFGRLTLAMHDLNLLLQEKLYPG